MCKKQNNGKIYSNSIFKSAFMGKMKVLGEKTESFNWKISNFDDEVYRYLWDIMKFVSWRMKSRNNYKLVNRDLNEVANSHHENVKTEMN